MEGFFVDDLGAVEGIGRVSSVEEEDSDCRAVIRVLTTQMGFVIRTVALPASAPAIMDSIVVSFLEAREERMAARSKKARVHSYPRLWCLEWKLEGSGGARGKGTNSSSIRSL